MKPTSLVVLLSVSTLAVVGCKKKEEAAAPTAGGSAAVAGGSATAKPVAGGAPEAKTIESDLGSIKVAVPAGWTDVEFGQGRMYSDPSGGMFPSHLIVGVDCLGMCNTIADNLKGAQDKHAAGQQEMNYAVEVMQQGTPSADGLEYELKLTKDGQSFFQYSKFVYQAGWPGAIGCKAQAMKEELRAPLKAACAGLTFTPKAADGGSAAAGGADTGSAGSGS